MSKNTNMPATRPAVYTKKDWDVKTIRAYKGLVMLVKGELPKGRYSSMTKAYLYHPVVKELFEKCGIPMEERMVLNLLFAMVREKTNERHIVSVSALRKWFNGGWSVEKSITYSTPKEPVTTTPKPRKKASNVDELISSMTVEERKALVEKLQVA